MAAATRTSLFGTTDPGWHSVPDRNSWSWCMKPGQSPREKKPLGVIEPPAGSPLAKTFAASFTRKQLLGSSGSLGGSLSSPSLHDRPSTMGNFPNGPCFGVKRAFGRSTVDLRMRGGEPARQGFAGTMPYYARGSGQGMQ
eukprot:TRINITY_DN22790_c0_g1_i1.p1 TRINITY_DN22790_c0_g1~~TRINITY_DN22790_c0_g1_i1.p1  ORF type:complete len:140 (+),score=7.81 TRINITY_DN22790_c0_g1_i1:72-491(+)